MTVQSNVGGEILEDKDNQVEETMVRRKIQSEDEVRRWYEDEGRSADWMVQEYARKYHIEITREAFYALATRRGWKAQQVRDETLLPWIVDEKHRHHKYAYALRALARQRAGKPIVPKQERAIAYLLSDLGIENAVVHYDRDLDGGFVLVPREDQDGDGLVRQPPPEHRSRSVQTR